MSAIERNELFEALDDWIESFPVDAVVQELRLLEREAVTLNAAIESLNRKLSMWEAAREVAARSNGNGNGHGSNGHGPNGYIGIPSGIRAVVDPPTKRQGVLAVLSQAADVNGMEGVRLRDIHGVLMAKGWIEPSSKARHALEATVSNMCARGEIERVRKGVYRLAPTKGSNGTGPGGYLGRKAGRARAGSPGATS